MPVKNDLLIFLYDHLPNDILESVINLIPSIGSDGLMSWMKIKLTLIGDEI